MWPKILNCTSLCRYQNTWCKNTITCQKKSNAKYSQIQVLCGGSMRYWWSCNQNDSAWHSCKLHNQGIFLHFLAFSCFSCLFMSFHVFSCLFMSFHVFSCLFMSFMSFHVFSCLFMSFHVFSCLFMSFHVFSCLFMSFHVFSCLFMSLLSSLYSVYSVYRWIHRSIGLEFCLCNLIAIKNNG